MQEIKQPYLLCLGNETELTYAKTAKGILDWRPEKCAGQLGLEGCSIDLGLPDLSMEEAAEKDIRTLILGVAPAGGAIPESWHSMLLLLSSILAKSANRKRAIWAGLLFAIAVFISYFAMWLGLFTALATATNVTVLKWIVWILWIVVWLANLKDFFWYGRWFVMEVPFAWRPKMQKILTKITSPVWAFFVWFIISLFLLPCTSGPYFTILWYLAAESNNLHFRWYIYLIVYNLIFVLPMIAIALLVWLWFKSAEDIAKLKNKNKKIIHLVVAVLMLWLGAYVLLTM